MARKKSRTPPPPRPVQAPKRRIEPRNPRRTRMYFIALGAIVLLGVLGLTSFFLGFGGGDDIRDALAAGGCKRESFPEQAARHVQKLPKAFEYNSTPATSGPHQPQPDAPAVWDVYDTPVEQIKLVHNLEHGGVVVQYGADVPDATVQDIVAWYRDDPNGIVVAPLPADVVKEKPELAGKIALTAWTHLQTCARFNDEAFSDFRDTYRGDGPERFPVSALQPGGQ